MIYRDGNGKCVEIHKNNHYTDLAYMKEILKVININIHNDDNQFKPILKQNIFTKGLVNQDNSSVKKFLRVNNITLKINLKN